MAIPFVPIQHPGFYPFMSGMADVSSSAFSRPAAPAGSSSAIIRKFVPWLADRVNDVGIEGLSESIQNFGSSVGSTGAALVRGLKDMKLPSSNSPSSASSLSSASSEVPSFLWADLAKHYGMDAKTAYQESLSNTAYQRSVKDMQAAGLNPAALFGSGRGTSASGVAYVSDSSSRGSGGSQSGQLFSKGTYNLISLLAGGAAVAVSKKPSYYWLGSSAAKAVMSALDGLL